MLQNIRHQRQKENCLVHLTAMAEHLPAAFLSLPFGCAEPQCCGVWPRAGGDLCESIRTDGFFFIYFNYRASAPASGMQSCRLIIYCLDFVHFFLEQLLVQLQW